MNTSKEKTNTNNIHPERKKVIKSFPIQCPVCNSEAVLYINSDDSEQIECFGSLHEWRKLACYYKPAKRRG